jgi:hypothetical protein
MNFSRGWAVSALLIAAATAAHAGPVVTAGAARSPYLPVSDFDGPYPDMPPAPIPAPPPRYGYGPAPAPEYGYRDDRYAPPERPYRPDGYRPDGYRPDYGYAPAFLPPNEVYAILRDNGFSALGAPRQRGNVYVIAVLDRDGEDGRLLIDAHSGRILRFVPASQSGGESYYEHMRYEPGAQAPRGGTEVLPEPTVIKADPRLLQAAPAVPDAPRMASRSVPLPAPRVVMPMTRPAMPGQQTAAVQAKPAEAQPAGAASAAPQTTAAVAPPQAGEQRPGSQILPTQEMPKVQGLE